MNFVCRFIKLYPDATSVTRADKSAMGTIPSKAMQYCEAIRTASSFGWYAFPAADVTLMFDGIDTYIEWDEEWEILASEHASDPDGWWNLTCPEPLRDKAPPFISSIGVPGYVQIWSGHLIQTQDDWSILVRPIANNSMSAQFFCFEGIVETDRFAPAPLFINLRLLQTNVPIKIRADKPLFQVQPIHRSCYSPSTLNSSVIEDVYSFTQNDWDGYLATVRSTEVATDNHKTGRYAEKTRKRARQDVKKGNI